MNTQHVLAVGDAADLSSVDDDSVELVVTSPPYPMIELWDELFAASDPAVAEALAAGDGDRAFEAMHVGLDEVWDELARVLAPGGIACVNVGDATRTLDGDFRLYPNHARVVSALTERGLSPLPDVLWRKPTNSGAKFMGSGTLPSNAYVTLEHEYVLIFRNGGPRSFPSGDDARYESAYFWEERNRWFSDVWEFPGVDQALAAETSRERSAAFPLALPLRLIRMFSVYGDTVLDPFAGTGTTALAALHAGRSSLSVDLDADLLSTLDERLEGLPDRSRNAVRERLDRHREFVRGRPSPPEHEAVHYDFRVVTRQERRIRLYAVEEVSRTTDRAVPTADDPVRYEATHAPVDDG